MTQPLRAQQLRRDFVINVSNDHIIERDIDLEIEARMQSAHLFETKQALSITSTQETDSIREDSFSSDFGI
jgi:hypothetical protein